MQVQVGDQNYVFTANINSGGTVTVALPYPIKTRQIRLYPASWQGTIELAMALRGYAPGKQAVVLLSDSVKLALTI
ncbi:hypothetical protein DPMN_117900 [Dreissena polymorpha]|uniref:F5/8 type C domain-containing protein n=1 Tax=Dreissena polymorpha TaxID=45954 RepID=A0A9D4GFS6_DREPO|nr:hypothetical protein DPMN_117900 [Dreissena polymorpha]